MKLEKLLNDCKKNVFFIYYENDSAKSFAQVSLRSDHVPGTTTSPIGYLKEIYALS